MFGDMVHVIYLALVMINISFTLVLSSKNVEYFKVEPLQDPVTYQINVLTTASTSVCEKEFLSVAIDTNSVRNNWIGIDFGSTKLKNLAKALVPVDLRFGGERADFLIFDPNATSSHEETKQDLNAITNFVMSGRQFDNLTTFVKEVGWNFIFDFNVFLRDNGTWDSSNADLILKYSDAKGVNISSFQLGNEPDLYARQFNVSITPSQLVESFQLLKDLIANYPKYKDGALFGPGVTNLGVRSRSMTYLRLFIEAGGANVTNEIGIHHYYQNGAIATIEDFYNTTLMDSLKIVLDVALNLTKVVPHRVPIRLTETSSCYGGGAPNLSNTYAAGFLWLDKLGIAAQYGLTRVFRQTFISGSYALVATGTLDPNPDFYLSVLFKRLVEGPVFPVIAQPELGKVRVYGHCARTDVFSYPPGALVLYYINLLDEDVILSLTQFSNQDQDLFQLTPGDDEGILSSFVKLNGQILLLSNDEVPQLLPVQHRGNVTAEAKSFGFIVIPQANVPACSKFHAKTK